MSPTELRVLVNQYRAGLEAEVTLLHQLVTLAKRQREIAESGDLTSAPQTVDTRDRVMASLVALEHELKPIRASLADHREALEHLEDYADLSREHHEAATLVQNILTADKTSLEALREAEEARRFAAKAIEQGESTLAAYRRVVAPPVAAASLMDRKG